MRDEIENEVEHGAQQTGMMMRSGEAVQWLLSFTRHSGHQIYSMMLTAEWEEVLDPSRSLETAEAVQSIIAGIALSSAPPTSAPGDEV